MKRLKSLYGSIPTPGGKRGCGESRPFICNGSNITLPGEGHFASRSGSSSTLASSPSRGFLSSCVSSLAWLVRPGTALRSP